MKRTFLKFPARPVSYLPKMQNRRMRLGLLSTTTNYLSDGGEGNEDEDPTATAEVKAIRAIGKQVENFKTALGAKADATLLQGVNEKLTELEKNLAQMNSTQVAEMLKDINDKNETMWKQIVEIQEENARKAEEGKPAAKKGKLFSSKEVEDFIKLTFDEQGKTRNAAKVEIATNKAAETFGVATFYEGGPDTITDAFTGRFVDPTLYQNKRKRNLILDNFDIRTINVPKLVYLIKVEEGDSNPVSGDPGGADWILSSEAKPKRSFRVTTGEAEAKKIAIFGTVEDKLLKDVASLERWIREDFMDELREGINDGLLNNDPGTNPKAPLGMKTNAVQYTATPAYDGTIADPNYIDEIFAVIAFMRYNKEEPGRIFVSTDVHTRIMHLKDANDAYRNNNLIYTNSVGQLFIGGVPIIPADEEDVPSTHILAVAVDLGFKMYAYGPMVFERGLNGEDFRYDRTSYRGYQEFLSFIPENRENSVLYDTWAAIEAAITSGS